MYTALIVVSLLLFAVLAWRNYRLALSLVIALLPTYLLRIQLGPLPSTWLEIALLITMSVWILRAKPSPSTARKALGPLLVPTLFLLIAATLGIAIADDTLSALGSWKTFFIKPFLLFVALRSSFEATDWHRTLRYLAVTVVVISILTILQRLTGLGIPAPWDVELRATSLFDFPNAVGLFLAPLVVLFGGLAYELRRNNIAKWFAVTSGFGLIGIVLAKTEAALIAVPAGLAIFIALRSSFSRRVVGMLTIACGTLAALALTIAPVREKVLLRDYSGLVRRSQWKETTEMLLDRPLTGAGLSGYPTALVPYHDGTLYEIFQYPHNVVLNIWSELGLLGILAFAAGAFVVILELKKRQNPAAILAFAAFTTMAIHGLVDVPYFKNDLAILSWTLI